MPTTRNVVVKVNPKRRIELAAVRPLRPPTSAKIEKALRAAILRKPQPGTTPLHRTGPTAAEPQRRMKLVPRKVELSPAASATRARRTLRLRFREANQNASAHARLRKADIYGTMKVAYAAVRAWRKRGVAQEVERLLRRSTTSVLAAQSSPFLVLLRAALPGLDAKRASKWAAAMALADRKGIARTNFVAFLERQGGVEGAAKAWARHREHIAEE